MTVEPMFSTPVGRLAYGGENDHMAVILVADDDWDDFVILRDALKESDLEHELFYVANGKELLDYLHGSGASKESLTPRPDLILLDLNMPILDGREALRTIKQEPNLRDIPIVVLTESLDESDCTYCLNMGVYSFFTKSAWMEKLAEVIGASGRYWFDLLTGRLHRAQ